jgi:hypothetical protein
MSAEIECEVYSFTKFDEMASGLILGFIPVFGVRIGEGFGSFDGEGTTNSGVGGDVHNHPLYADGLSKTDADLWTVDAINAHSMSWGNRGRIRLPESVFPCGGTNIEGYLIKALP